MVRKGSPVRVRLRALVMAAGTDPDGGRLRRREFLIASAAAGLAVSGPVNYAALARGRRLPFARGGAFAHGVAAGMPAPKSITLWTRVSGLERSSRLLLEVATDRRFANVVRRKPVVAQRNRDFTVHAAVRGLAPHREYFYRFQTRDTHSRVGRFRTAPPADSRQPVRIGFYSCQSYEAGFYTALAGLAKEPDLDLVLCLGDYIYEFNFYEEDGPEQRRDRSGRNRDGEVQRLSRVPPEVPPLPARPEPAGDARQASVPGDLGRPRGRGQLRRRRRRLRPGRSQPHQPGHAPQRSLRPAPAQRLPGLLRGDAAAADSGRRQPHLRADPTGRPLRAVPARPAPVPRPAALWRRAWRSPAPRTTSRGGRCSASARSSG